MPSETLALTSPIAHRSFDLRTAPVRRVADRRTTSSVTVLSEQFAHLCLVVSCDKQGTSAERERGTRLRVLVAKQLDA
jgi:hypothetical protein